jgi:2-polyprenyl-3-methyl-5-hydroxy-6-metoxy-1,4-benzoquinol methylase
MQTASHNSVVLDQYSTRASAYVHSAVHAAGQDLDLIAQVLANQRGAVALDVGCGGGHLTYRLAPLVKKVVACDLTDSMLAAVVEQASLRGLPDWSRGRGGGRQLQERRGGGRRGGNKATHV